MEMKQLRYFIEVAEREHMSEAANELLVAQSAISRQISNLEKELGVSLFEREGRSIKLLPIGKVLLTHAKEALNVLDQAERQIQEFTEPERGTIKIGFPTSLATNVLPRLIQHFLKQYPNIQFQLRQGSYHFLVEAIKSRQLNLAFLGPVITEDPAIHADILFWENMKLLVSDTHPLAKEKSVKLADLDKENFILFPKGYILEQLVIEACLNEGFHPNVSTQGEDMDAIKGMVSAGIGITLLPESACAKVENDYLVQIPVQSEHIRRSVGMITPKNRELGPSEKVFYTFTKDYFEDR